MGDYLITCVIKSSSRKSTSPDPRHEHITDVGVNGVNNGMPVSVKQIYADMERGNTFYTFSPSTRTRAAVRPYNCTCRFPTLRSYSDGVPDNNLDNLRSCG
jgi:hypothetical protein